MKPHEEELNSPHRVALVRAWNEGHFSPRDLARLQGTHEQAVRRVLYGDNPGRWWVPRLLADLIPGADGARIAGEVSGLTDAGCVVTRAPEASSSPDSLALAAVQLGGSAGDVQRLVAAALSPDSPGGAAIVGPEELQIRRAIDSLHRAAARLEQLVGQERST